MLFFLVSLFIHFRRILLHSIILILRSSSSNPHAIAGIQLPEPGIAVAACWLHSGLQWVLSILFLHMWSVAAGGCVQHVIHPFNTSLPLISTWPHSTCNMEGLKIDLCPSFPVYHHLCLPSLHRAMLTTETSSCQKRQDLHSKWRSKEIPHQGDQHRWTSPQSQSPCLHTEVTEIYLKPGLKPSALNLWKPPSLNIYGLTLPCCFTIRPLQEVQLTSSKLIHGNLVTFQCVHLINLKIYHDTHQV